MTEQLGNFCQHTKETLTPPKTLQIQIEHPYLSKYLKECARKRNTPLKCFNPLHLSQFLPIMFKKKYVSDLSYGCFFSNWWMSFLLCHQVLSLLVRNLSVRPFTWYSFRAYATSNLLYVASYNLGWSSLKVTQASF